MIEKDNSCTILVMFRSVNMNRRGLRAADEFQRVGSTTPLRAHRGSLILVPPAEHVSFTDAPPQTHAARVCNGPSRSETLAWSSCAGASCPQDRLTQPARESVSATSKLPRSPASAIFAVAVHCAGP